MLLSGVLGSRLREGDTGLGDVGTAASVEAEEADFLRLTGSSHTARGTSGRKHPSRTDVTEIRESMPIPDHQALGLLGFVHCFFVVMAFLFV